MQIQTSCSRCDRRSAVAIASREADALSAFRAAANERRRACPQCGDVGIEIILIDDYQRTVKRTPANVR